MKKELLKYINDAVLKHLPDPDQYPAKVVEAMNYAMEAGGKRIRPTLMYLTYKAFGGENESVIEAYMAAIEMIHTHSLIHDDLPALDNDALRRGRPTVHVQFDEATAILAGDALLNYAYETVSRANMNAYKENIVGENDDKKIDSKRLFMAQDILLRKTGINGMLGGQSIDVEKSGQAISDEIRDYIYKNKTCALIEAPVMIGASLSGYADVPFDRLEEAGEAIGMAFQVQDDVLDVIGDAEKLGKEVSQDARNEKNTYVASYGIDAAKEYVKKQSENAVEIIKETVPDNDYRSELIALILEMIDRDK